MRFGFRFPCFSFFSCLELQVCFLLCKHFAIQVLHALISIISGKKPSTADSTLYLEELSKSKLHNFQTFYFLARFLGRNSVWSKNDFFHNLFTVKFPYRFKNVNRVYYFSIFYLIEFVDRKF